MSNSNYYFNEARQKLLEKLGHNNFTIKTKFISNSDNVIIFSVPEMENYFESLEGRDIYFFLLEGTSSDCLPYQGKWNLFRTPEGGFNSNLVYITKYVQSHKKAGESRYILMPKNLVQIAGEHISFPAPNLSQYELGQVKVKQELDSFGPSESKQNTEKSSNLDSALANMTIREFAAIILRSPTSGNKELDEMIQNASFVVNIEHKA